MKRAYLSLSKNNFCCLFIFIFSACATIENPNVKDISSSQFESIKIGAATSDVLAILGSPPKKVLSDNKEKSTEGWIYSNSDRLASQRAAISFDTSVHQVVSKTFIPREGEPEEKIDFLLKEKFAGQQFEKIPLPRCQRDYVPMQTLYINTQKGIVIEYDRHSDTVESITWTSTDEATQEINKIKSCL